MDSRIAGVELVMNPTSGLRAEQVVELADPRYEQADVLVGLDDLGLLPLGFFLSRVGKRAVPAGRVDQRVSSIQQDVAQQPLSPLRASVHTQQRKVATVLSQVLGMEGLVMGYGPQLQDERLVFSTPRQELILIKVPLDQDLRDCGL
jgi:hypothetical protein